MSKDFSRDLIHDAEFWNSDIKWGQPGDGYIAIVNDDISAFYQSSESRQGNRNSSQTWMRYPNDLQSVNDFSLWETGLRCRNDRYVVLPRQPSEDLVNVQWSPSAGVMSDVSVRENYYPLQDKGPFKRFGNS